MRIKILILGFEVFSEGQQVWRQDVPLSKRTLLTEYYTSSSVFDFILLFPRFLGYSVTSGSFTDPNKRRIGLL